jgi:predicted DNA-binding protein (MmcQ/YjbR family)
MNGSTDSGERFRRLRVREDCAIAGFGFKRKAGVWEYSEPVVDGTFSCSVTIDKTGAVSERVIDCATGEEYVQHRVAAATGAFVGRVRQEVDAILERIAAACFERDVFKTDLAQHMIAFARETWGDELEFLWKQFPDYAVLRRADTQKWYAVIMRLSRRKLGFNSDETVEIIDLRREADTDDPRFLPGYHMNKKTWMTVVLDGTTPFGELAKLFAASHDAANQ